MPSGIDAKNVIVHYDCGPKNKKSVMNCTGLQPVGGTETKLLTTAASGKLFMGTGMWLDTPVAGEAAAGCTVQVMSAGANKKFEIENVFPVQDTATSILYNCSFTNPVAATRFIVGTWNSRGWDDIWVRDSTTGSWNISQRIATGKDPSQQRSAIMFTDPVVNVSRLFIGNQPWGIFSMTYDTNCRGGLSPVTWEFDTTKLPPPPTNAPYPRVASFAVLNNKLYATVASSIYERVNGKDPSWKLAWTDPNPGTSDTGLRGLTAMASSGYMFAAREGGQGAILKLTPGSPWKMEIAYDMIKELSAAWTRLYGATVKSSYTIAAYNDMKLVQMPAGHWVMVVGFQSFVNQFPKNMPTQNLPQKGGNLMALGCFMTWNYFKDGKWRFNHLPAVTSQDMVATRTVCLFDGRMFMGGYDCNKEPGQHNSAWCVSTPLNNLMDNYIE
jgi:hypothetical protein